MITLALLLAASTLAEDGKPPSTGLSIVGGAAAFVASNSTADFYAGLPQNANTIDRVLHSDTYGRTIWQSLVNQGLISPSDIGSHAALRVEEFPRMEYRLSMQYGLGIRYDYASGFGWMLRFDIAQLQAIGAFNLGSQSGSGILGSNQYVRCGMAGREDRIAIDLALTRSVSLGEAWLLELDLGAQLLNTRVKENLMEVAGNTYSILDVWGGRTPDAGVGSYDYVNQGGIGYGVYAGFWIGLRVGGVGNIKVGYSCLQQHVILEGYSAWGWQHSFGLRLEMNSFDFLK